MAQWYCKLSGSVSGPFALEELQFLRDRGKLASDDEVREGTSSSWAPARSLAVLFPHDPKPVEQLSSVKSAQPTMASQQPPGVTGIGNETPLAAPSVRTETPPFRPGGLPPPPPRHDRRTEIRKRVLLGIAIGVATVILILILLLLLLRAVGNGGGQGSGRGHGIGDGVGDGMGNGSGSGVGGGSSRGAGETADNDEPSPGDGGAGGAAKKPDDSSRVAPAEGPSPEPTPAKEPPPTGLFEIARLSPPPAPATPTGPGVGDGGAGGRGGRGGGGGSLGDFEERLKREGAKTGDVQISLLWNNFNDLDLHVVCPSGERIFFGHKQSACNGELDVDMNAGGPTSNKPVENVYWPHGGTPKGRFEVYVHHFANHGGVDPTKFRVAVKAGSRTRTFSGSVTYGDPPKLIHTFTR